MPHLTVNRAQIDAMIDAMQTVAEDCIEKAARADRVRMALEDIRIADNAIPARDPATGKTMSDARFTELWTVLVPQVNAIAGRTVVANPSAPVAATTGAGEGA